jgi:molecular chaperone GrpE
MCIAPGRRHLVIPARVSTPALARTARTLPLDLMKSRHSDRHTAGRPKETETEPREEQGADTVEGGGEAAPAAGSAAPREPQGSREADGVAGTPGDGDAAGANAAAVATELEAQRDRYLRLAAEYDNYRKRSERERAESGTRAQAQIVERLLEAIDDLQRVSQYDAEKTTAAAVLEGVQLVERKLLRLLESAGLEVVEAEGQPFDPEIHEAIATVATEAREEDDTVSDVFQRGYLFKGQLVRPARVRVRKHEG